MRLAWVLLRVVATTAVVARADTHVVVLHVIITTRIFIHDHECDWYHCRHPHHRRKCLRPDQRSPPPGRRRSRPARAEKPLVGEASVVAPSRRRDRSPLPPPAAVVVHATETDDSVSGGGTAALRRRLRRRNRRRRPRHNHCDNAPRRGRAGRRDTPSDHSSTGGVVRAARL